MSLFLKFQRRPETQTDAIRESPPDGPNIASELHDQRGREGVSYVEVHFYDTFPHEFAHDSNLFAYVSDSRPRISNFTGIRRSSICRRFDRTSDQLNEDLRVAFEEKHIRFTYHGLMKEVYIYSFNNAYVKDIAGIVALLD